LFDALSYRWKLWRCAHVGEGTVVLGRVWIHGAGEVSLGRRVRLNGQDVPIELHARLPGSRIVIGDDVVIEGGSSIEAEESISIGAGTRLGEYVKVMDNHFHPLRGNRHERPKSSAVRVEENVVIGPHAILLPGTHLHPKVRVLPGSVVSRKVPEGMVVGGVPATRRKEGSS
jgi:acetyltransferase-like isoleucine patch superfamily enzyme